MTGLEMARAIEEALRSLERATLASATALPGAEGPLKLKAETYAEAALIAKGFRTVEERTK